MEPVLSERPPIVVVNTYNRPAHLRRLLSDLAPQLASMGAELWVVDDGSEPFYAESMCRVLKTPWTIHKQRHHGKAEYWRLWDSTIEHLHAKGAREVCFLPDDVRVKPGALDQLRRQWAVLKEDDPRAVSLNPLVDKRGRGPNWTIMTPSPLTLRGGEVVWHTGWFDLCGWVDERFLLTIDRVFEVPSDWLTYIGSSGVGAQITMTLYTKGLRMYQVEHGLLDHGRHASLMNPYERLLNPL
jgi:hypothetical protein